MSKKKKKREPIFTYNDSGNFCSCEVRDSLGRVFKGEAHCHPKDEDYKSYLTGGTIAEARAQIAAATAYRNDLKIKLAALRQYYYSICQSKHFNKDSYEVKMLFRQIKLLESDLEIAKHQLAVLKLDLFEYLNNKEYTYNMLRKHRNEKMSSNK